MHQLQYISCIVVLGPRQNAIMHVVKDRNEGFARIAEIVALESLIKISS